MIEWAVDRPGLRLGCGDGSSYDGDADLVLCDLYGPLPAQLVGRPAVVNATPARVEQVRGWLAAEPWEIGTWGRGNTVFAANIDLSPVSVGGLVEEEFAPGRGWFPLALPMRLLAAYGRFGLIVYDGFMGRGTVGMACQEFGHSFVGIDRDPARVALAREYLGC